MFAPRTFPVGRPRSLLRKLAGAQLLCERAIAQRWCSGLRFATWKRMGGGVVRVQGIRQTAYLLS